MSPRAYDLVGTVESPAELFPRLEALELMAESLSERGLTEAAAETRLLAEETREFAKLADARSCRLRGLWNAIETAASPYTPTAEATTNITREAVAYRAVLEQGTRLS